MNLLTQNSKLKKTSKELSVRVFNFGIPAYKSASGKITCPFADACVKFCYARKGAYIWSNVQPAFEKRYQLSKTDQFVSEMYKEIVKKKPDYVRFYSYTNSVLLLKKATLPDNFDVIFSDSGKQKHHIDAIHDRHTRIFQSEAELEKAGYANASKVDLYATKWFNPTNKVGLVYH